MDLKAAAGALDRAGLLVPKEKGRWQRSERVAELDAVRVYVIRETILSGEVAQ